MTPVYCGTCGTGLGEDAKFCRACGSAQASAPAHQAPAPPLPPPPAAYAPAAPLPGAARRALSALETVAALLALVGGAAMCFMTLYGTVYLPLHHDYGLNYDQSLRIGDALALASGVVAIAIGTLILSRRPGNATARGIWLVAAGTPTLIMSLLWSFPETFHLTLYPVPFYFAYVYFTDLGFAHIGDGYVLVPLVLGCAMVSAAGFLVATPSATRPTRPGPR
ncbi:MAG TPA: zinc ribbon domain-containing protein [Solirubrobacterales bacterium]|jgi:hypothetical protein|nr:zinc ribbon domain-containing protein [Solirubrobacterales bacterium]